MALWFMGRVLYGVGSIWIIFVAASESSGWMLVSIFVPFGNVIFVSTHWKEAKPACTCYLAGAVLMSVGLFADYVERGPPPETIRAVPIQRVLPAPVQAPPLPSSDSIIID